jgi:UDP-2-acetamido-2,6-beta-L-arabino-hexul-4-ose reductase
MYTAYLSEDGLAYSADMHTDERGSFTELFKSEDRGQVSVNIIKPGVVKGNHYHHTKTEKFAVVCGSGVIRFRRVGDDRVIQYAVTGAEIRIVDIPCGYTHNIENTGSSDMAVVMWCSECYDPDRPDTYFLKV